MGRIKREKRDLLIINLSIGGDYERKKQRIEREQKGAAEESQREEKGKEREKESLTFVLFTRGNHLIVLGY